VRFLAALAAAVAAAFVAAGSAVAAQDSTCPNGILASGIYLNVTVNSFCSTSGSVLIRGNLSVNGGGVFNTSGGSVFVAGSVAVFPTGVLNLVESTVLHGVSADRATSMIVAADEIDGGVQILGGGGGPSGSCERSDVPLTGIPEAVVAENEIGGSVAVGSYRGCVAAVIENLIGGSLSFVNNTVGAPDGNIIGSNLITHNLFCKGNVPNPSLNIFGLNSVGGSVNFPGQCVDLVP
jgi:hypothetical protein